jgi:ankyrin repeat protein
MSYQLAHSKRLSANSGDTIPTVVELATGHVTQLTSWMVSRDGRTNVEKLAQVFYMAANYGSDNICEAIIDSGRLSDKHLLGALSVACTRADGIPVAQLIVRRGRATTQHLHDALIDCCTEGHAATMQWLLSEIQLSHDERVTWRLATASACGDINTVKLLAAHVERDHTSVMSHALRTASYNGRVDVVDWLMTHTTADVSLCGEINTFYGTMTSLAAACYRGHADTVVTLLQCVTPHTVNIQCGLYMDSALHFTIWYTGPTWYRSETLHKACLRSNRERVSSLLYSVDVDEQDASGRTPLHNACHMDYKNIVRALLSVFANTDTTDDDKYTPMDAAKFYNNTNVLSCFTPLLSSRDTTHTVYVTQSAAVDVVVSDVTISEAHSATRDNRHSHTQQHRLTREVNTANNRRDMKAVHVV